MIQTRWSRQLFLAKKNTLALSWYYITKLYNIKNQFWKVKNNYCVSSTFQAEVLTKQEYVRPFVSSSSPVKCSKDIRNLRGRKKKKKKSCFGCGLGRSLWDHTEQSILKYSLAHLGNKFVG